MKKISVLGCGVIGLTTAIILERAGYDVKIITKNLHFKTTSAIAAAIWMPYKADPIDLVNSWSLATYHVLEKMSHDPITGVKMIDFLYLTQTDEIPPWENAIPAKHLRKATKKELPYAYTFGYVARLPMIETPIYLEYLFDEFRGEILMDEILSLDEVCTPENIVINCTGLGAKLLTNDDALYPVKGQIVKMQAKSDLLFAADDHPDHFFYILPRKDCVVLGGTALVNNYNLEPDALATSTIIDRVKKVVPEIENLPLQKVEVGLRPYRSSIRLEKETDRNIIHNYGHGGSGFTVSWACAEEVLKLINSLND